MRATHRQMPQVPLHFGVEAGVHHESIARPIGRLTVQRGSQQKFLTAASVHLLIEVGRRTSRPREHDAVAAWRPDREEGEVVRVRREARREVAFAVDQPDVFVLCDWIDALDGQRLLVGRERRLCEGLRATDGFEGCPATIEPYQLRRGVGDRSVHKRVIVGHRERRSRVRRFVQNALGNRFRLADDFQSRRVEWVCQQCAARCAPGGT